MTRFDIGVLVVTFLVLGVGAIIRNVVAPIIRLRVSRYRLVSSPRGQDETNVRLRAQERSNAELESRASLDELRQPACEPAKDKAP